MLPIYFPLSPCSTYIAAVSAFAAVESPNIVGYSTVTAKKDAWLLTSVQFEGVDGNDAQLSNLIKGDYVAIDFDEDFFFVDTAPVVMVPKAAGGYSNFYYINFEESTFWFDFDAGGPDEGTPIAAGTGIWFKQTGADCSVTFAGQVVSDSSVPVPAAKSTWNLLSNPYPIACAISDLTYSGIVGIDFDEDFAFVETAPVLMVPKAAGGYSNFYYINFEESTFWFDFDAGGPDEGATVPVGSGFWFKAATDVTITFTK